jgi:3-oxoacyl-[acyl-carrier-protein] synthase III
MKAFITSISTLLPGNPVSNDDLDDYLGKVHKISAKTRRIILANNGIKSRYYALNPQTGKATYTNAQMTAEAVRKLSIDESLIESLCCGTSTPDQLLPGHGSMVHGELDAGICEVITTAGVCLTCLAALKYGAMSVALGLTHNAVATGSELASSSLRDDFFQAMSGKQGAREKERTHPAFSFEAEFLRWMLSDGAGAVLIEREPAASGLSLQIEWIENTSHAHRLDACMYSGAVKQENGSLVGWREYALTDGLDKQGILTIKQDARLLNQEIIPVILDESLPVIIDKHTLKAEDVDWFLPHISSEYFREPLWEKLQEINFPISRDRWFTNLTTKGNTGSASFYIMLEELLASGKVQKGDRILGMVPESGRFSVGWIYLTVV